MSTNYIDQITDTGGTTHDISEGDSTRIFRATCNTGAGTTAKVATLQTSSRNFSLATGVRVAVTFQYGNSVASPTLNVNNSGAKTIAVATSATAKATGNGTTYNTWGAYETVLFTYDGTYWVNEGSSRSIYNAYALADSKSSFSGSYNDLTDKPTIPTNTDEKLKVENISNNTNYSLLLMPSSGTIPRTTTGNIDAYEFAVLTNGSSYSQLNIGGENFRGQIGLGYKNNNVTNYTLLKSTHTSESRTISFPDKTGTVALTTDIPTVPTKTSDLTNDSGFITTDSDKKLEIGAVANNTTKTTYYPILATNSTTAATRYYDSTGILYNNVNGSASAVGIADLVLGNSTASGNANNKKGTISLYSSTSNYGFFTTADLTAQRTYTFPDKSGIVAFTSDVTDEKVTSTATSATTTNTYYLTGSPYSSTTTGGLNKHASVNAVVTADSDTSGSATVTLGNSIASGTAGSKQGYIRLYGTTAYYHQIQGYTSYPAANRTVYLPRYAGTMYLTCASTAAAVGGATTKPVYVDNTGRIQAVTSIPYTLLTGTPAVTEVEIVRW